MLHLEYVTATPANQAPIVSAGPDVSVTMPNPAPLGGQASDDGLPDGGLVTNWSLVDGPGTVSFGDPSSPSTVATFSVSGTYLLRLSADDGERSSSDEVIVTVAAPDTDPPSMPTGLSAVAPGATRVDLSWTASTDNVGVVDYAVVREGVTIGTSSTTTYQDATVLPETTYTYRVVARDSAGLSSDPSGLATVTTPGVPESLTFTAAGDHGANTNTEATLSVLDGSGSDFYLALGDMDYNETATDEAWCDFVTTRLPTLGATFPFQLVSGNHEEQGSPEGYILNHAACLPDRLDSTVGPGSHYGVEYRFDYPAASPLARVIMIAPGLTVDNVTYSYASGDPHHQWVADSIDEARAQGIPWVIVAMHKTCYSAGRHGCSMSSALLNLLVEKRVDLVLQGHEHNYQRSKQLARNVATCPTLPTDSYDADCVVDDGWDHHYLRSAGTVFVVAGTFGRSLYAINPQDEHFPYFAVTDATSRGLVRYTVTPDRIDAEFLPSMGSLTDAFSIVPPGTNQPPNVRAGLDMSVVLPDPVNLSGSVTDDGLPNPTGTTATWSVSSGPGNVTFADPGAPVTTASFSSPGLYVLRLSATDSELTAWDDLTVVADEQGGAPTVLEVATTQNADDAEESPAGSVSLTSSDLELVQDGTSIQTVGLRFSGLPIPAGATITSAWVQFEADEISSVATSLTVQGQAADDAAAFTSTSANISSRARTTASVAWSPPPWTIVHERGANQRTPGLSAVIQAIVSRPGWSLGNALALVVTGTGRRTAEAFDGTAPPVLHVEYVIG